jgi:hypothetical protein
MAGDKIKILALSLIYTNFHSHGRTSPQYAYMWHQHDPKKFKIFFFSIASSLVPLGGSGTCLQQLKSKVGLALAKAAALRIVLNLDGAPIASKSHTHPSHS